jgi:tetratricopeptide (TPR) repeat protein
MASWWRLSVALALIAAFVAAIHRSSPGRVAAAAAAPCELGPAPTMGDLEACLQARPDDVAAMLDLAAAYEFSGHAGRAEAVYRRAADVDPLDADAHLRLGRLLRQRGDRAAARAAGERALAIRPNSAEALALVRP